MEETEHKHEEIKPVQPRKEDTITITKTTLWQGISLLLVVALAASVFTGGFGYGSTPTGNAVAQPTAAPTQPSQPSAEVNLEGAYIKGDEDAPVTIVEFSDFQCPFCGRFYTQTLGQIEQSYVDEGKVKFAYMHFPLDSIHPQATPAALASECAGEQGKFWEYHDLLFENQAQLSDSNYRTWAENLGLDIDQFNECYDSQEYLSKVQAQFSAGQAAGIRGTPGFLINGQLVSGAQPFAAFQQVIDSQLN